MTLTAPTRDECLSYMERTERAVIERAALRLYPGYSAYLIKTRERLRVDQSPHGPSIILEGAHLLAVLRYCIETDKSMERKNV